MYVLRTPYYNSRVTMLGFFVYGKGGGGVTDNFSRIVPIILANFCAEEPRKNLDGKLNFTLFIQVSPANNLLKCSLFPPPPGNSYTILFRDEKPFWKQVFQLCRRNYRSTKKIFQTYNFLC